MAISRDHPRSAIRLSTCNCWIWYFTRWSQSPFSNWNQSLTTIATTVQTNPLHFRILSRLSKRKPSRRTIAPTTTSLSQNRLYQYGRSAITAITIGRFLQSKLPIRHAFGKPPSTHGFSYTTDYLFLSSIPTILATSHSRFIHSSRSNLPTHIS